jgi:hypothetical protein
MIIFFFAGSLPAHSDLQFLRDGIRYALQSILENT